MAVTFKNFFDSTFANFKKIKASQLPKKEPDYISNSGSKYWYDKAGKKVYRSSNHWFRGVSSCKWFLDGLSVWTTSHGVANLSDFKFIKSIKCDIGKKYTVFSAARTKDGTEVLEKRVGKFEGETQYFHKFDFGKVKDTSIVLIEKA
jgi:hypothetical protein